MQITAVRYHYIPTRMAIIWNTDGTKWWGCGAIGTLIPCWWEHKTVQPHCKTVRSFPANLNLLFIVKSNNCSPWYQPQNSWKHVVVQSHRRVRLFATPWTAARQASLPLTISWSMPKFIPVAMVMPANHLTLWCPLLLLPSVFASIRVFSNERTVCIRWPKYGSFSFIISPSNEYSGLTSLKLDWFDLLAVQETFGSLSSTTVLKYQFFVILPSLWSSSHNHMWPLGRP